MFVSQRITMIFITDMKMILKYECVSLWQLNEYRMGPLLVYLLSYSYFHFSYVTSSSIMVGMHEFTEYYHSKEKRERYLSNHLNYKLNVQHGTHMKFQTFIHPPVFLYQL